MIVADASAIALALIGEGNPGHRAREALRGRVLYAPELLYVEVLSALRRLSAAGTLSRSRAASAVDDLFDLPINTASHRALLHRTWKLRGSITAYDATYVSLAAALECPLLTADLPLARAAGRWCTVEQLLT